MFTLKNNEPTQPKTVSSIVDRFNKEFQEVVEQQSQIVEEQQKVVDEASRKLNAAEVEKTLATQAMDRMADFFGLNSVEGE